MADAAGVLAVEDRGPIRIVALNRPGKRNALNDELTGALYETLVATAADRAVRAVVLTGAPPAFCAGADTTEFTQLTAAHPDAVWRRSELTANCHMQLQRLPQPVVAAVRGAALGGGAGLALACDLMVVGDDVRFGFPETGRSIVPAVVMTSVQRNLGRKRAFELISTGRLVGSDELCAWGLAARRVASEEVLAAALEITGSWSEINPFALSTSKELFYRVADAPYEEAMRLGRDANRMMREFPGRTS